MSQETFGQMFLNGDFEFNSAGIDQINLPNAQYNSFMANSFAFGNLSGGGPLGGDMDIITSNLFCGFAQSGNWYVALTGGGTDAISLTLSSQLIIGNVYTISYYDRSCVPFATFPTQIGLSTSNNTFGTLLHTELTPLDIWTQRTFTFTAPNNGQYITIQLNAGDGSSWCQIDNFTFEGSDSTFEVSELIVDMPNVFTPNNDGENDYFCPIKMKGVEDPLLIIYNRWGVKLFETNNLLVGWDGKHNGMECSNGTYFWVVQTKPNIKGSNTMKGFLTLLK